MRLAPAFEQLLAGWKAQGWTLVSDARAVRDAAAAGAAALRSRRPATVAGPHAARCWCRAREFLADVDLAQRRDPHCAHMLDITRRSPMLGKKVADFTAPATGGDVQAVRPQGPAGRPLLLSEGQHARLHRPKARSSATCTSSSRRLGARRRRRLARLAQVARELQGEDGVSRSSSSPTPTRSCARSSASSR